MFSIILGPANTESIEELEVLDNDDQDLDQLREECREVYKEAIRQIKKRFVFDDEFFNIVQLVLPRNARTLNPPTLRNLFRRFPELKEACDPAKAEIEWRSHSLIPPASLGCSTEDAVRILEAETYWQLVLNVATTGDTSTKRFPNLTVIISFLFSIPCSNAASERVFSVLKLNKTVQRNALSNKVFGSLVRIKDMLKDQGADSDTVVFDDELVSRVTKVRANKSLPNGA